MKYRICGNSGVYLPELSLGLWHNFGDVDDFEEARRMIVRAFDAGICHFDLANNYGPEPGSAERNFGRILKSDLAGHRDEMFISSKAGHRMWPGVYGDGCSRKNLMASCDASLQRTGLDYFDVFYTHRYDGVTPLEETMGALIDIVRHGKALYVGISKYPAAMQVKAYEMLKEAGVPCLVSQYRASMFDKKAINENFEIASAAGSGIVCFSPLAQGLLTDKYLHGIPENSRAHHSWGFLKESDVNEARVDAARKLNEIAKSRGVTLAQMAIAWLLADPRVTSVIVGASSVTQLEANLNALDCPAFSESDLDEIAAISSAPSISF